MNQARDTRSEIMKSALSLFALKGFDAVSTAEIVQAAEITKPTMYYYFGSKEGLLTEILSTHYDRFIEELNKAASIPTDIPLTYFRLMKVYFDYAVCNRDFIQLRSQLLQRVGEDTAYLTAKPFLDRETRLIQDFFNTAATVAGNIKGKEQFCTLSFMGIANAVIGDYLHSDDASFLCDETIYRLRQQFLYGIYS